MLETPRSFRMAPTDRVPTPDLLHQALLGEGADSASLGVSVYDDDGRIVALNKRAAELLGYSRDEVLAHDIADFTEGGIDRSVLRHSTLREGVRLVHRKDGSTVPAAFVVGTAKLAGLPYFFAVWWELAPGDPRAAGAS
jgi:PAS domain S-box-containing protein